MAENAHFRSNLRNGEESRWMDPAEIYDLFDLY